MQISAITDLLTDTIKSIGVLSIIGAAIKGFKWYFGIPKLVVWVETQTNSQEFPGSKVLVIKVSNHSPIAFQIGACGFVEDIGDMTVVKPGHDPNDKPTFPWKPMKLKPGLNHTYFILNHGFDVLPKRNFNPITIGILDGLDNLWVAKSSNFIQSYSEMKEWDSPSRHNPHDWTSNKVKIPKGNWYSRLQRWSNKHK